MGYEDLLRYLQNDTKFFVGHEICNIKPDIQLILSTACELSMVQILWWMQYMGVILLKVQPGELIYPHNTQLYRCIHFDIN